MTNYGTKQGDFLGQEKLILGHNKMKYGTEQGDFFGTGEVDMVITRQILDVNKLNFWDRRSRFWVLTKINYGT
jgi:hypothetical protein